MIDIVNFEGEVPKLGYSKVHRFNEFSIGKGGTYDKNLSLVENRKTDIILNVENVPNNDKTHYRNSGLNHQICELAKQHKIAVAFSFSNLLNAKNVARTIGRMRQNVRLCRKYKIKMVLASFAENAFEMRHAKDLMAFGRVLGMTGSEVNKAMSFEKKKSNFSILA